MFAINRIGPGLSLPMQLGLLSPNVVLKQTNSKRKFVRECEFKTIQRGGIGDLTPRGNPE
jgi:hypothetical protein